MRFRIKYIGGIGEIDFNKSPFSYITHTFSNYQHDYTAISRPMTFGSKIDKFNRFGKEYTLSINVVEQSKEKLYKAMNEMTRVFEHDINEMTPGKLCVNDRYVMGYFTSAIDENWELSGNAFIVNLTFYALDPYWIKEKTFRHNVFGDVLDNIGFKLPMGFPTHFVAKETVFGVENAESKGSLAKIIFYGPVINPSIEIGGQTYAVKGQLLENERYEIDQRDKSVTKIDSTGVRFNAFNDRQKHPSVFTPLPRGNHVVSYDYNFSVEIILYEGSVEPEWS